MMSTLRSRATSIELPWDLGLVCVVTLLCSACPEQRAGTEQASPRPEPLVTSTVEVKPAPPLPTVSGTSGIVDLVVGAGPEVRVGQKVRVHYVGTLTNGKQFDSSHDKKKPYVFMVGASQVIKGWDEGILGMRVGGKRRLTIPPALAYGEKGRLPLIPPNATLIFDIELLDIVR